MVKREFTLAIEYFCKKDVVESCVKKLSDAGRVARDAYFNSDAKDLLRKEVAYRDPDFLEMLGYTKEIEVVDSILTMLKHHGVADDAADYSREAFVGLRKEVKKKFTNNLVLQQTGSLGTITPVMERLLYMLTSVKRPRRIIAVGIFWGNAFIWNVGSSCGKGKVYDAEIVYGIDVNERAIENAMKNIAGFDSSDHIELIAGDGLELAETIEGPFDFVFLDVGTANDKRLNLPILQKLYSKLALGCWVVTHDTTLPFFKNQMRPYLKFVRDQHFFSESISFEVDQYGLELSIKK